MVYKVEDMTNTVDQGNSEKLKTHLKTMTDRFIECCAKAVTQLIYTGGGDITLVNVEVDKCTLVVFIDHVYNAWKFEILYDEDMLPYCTMLGDKIKEEEEEEEDYGIGWSPGWIWSGCNWKWDGVGRKKPMPFSIIHLQSILKKKNECRKPSKIHGLKSR